MFHKIDGLFTLLKGKMRQMGKKLFVGTKICSSDSFCFMREKPAQSDIWNSPSFIHASINRWIFGYIKTVQSM